MTRQVDTETLREWLDAHVPVTVLDIRTDEDRAQWAIPGSLHIDAYEAVRSGDPDALADLALDPARPVVTVCNAGKVSQTAADLLTQRGFDARSLSGGMKTWSLAWNTARVPLADDSATVIQVRRAGKGCLSYVIEYADDDAVIDPSVSPDVYVDIAKAHGWTIRCVFDTHIHADHLSRARELARQTGAALVLPPQDRVHFAFVPIGRVVTGPYSSRYLELIPKFERLAAHSDARLRPSGRRGLEWARVNADRELRTEKAEAVRGR